MRDMMKRTNLKNKYYIELCGCDDTTPFVMELDEVVHPNIRRCLNGITKKAYGFTWKELDE